MVAPINELTRRIKKSVKKLRKFGQLQQRYELPAEEQSKMYSALQIDLLREFVSVNREINTLYFQFHLKAKIVFTARAVSNQNHLGYDF